MPGQQASCRLMTCSSFEAVVRLLLSEKYRGIVDEYRSILEEDPEYLNHHFMSAMLRLQSRLKLNDLPQLNVGGCINEDSGHCCVVDALEEATRRRVSAK